MSLPKFIPAALLALPLLCAAATPAAPPSQPCCAPSAQVTAPRTQLMRQAESDLGAGRSAEAAAEFERAVTMMHAPDAELGMTRSYMQQGHYREALFHAAHTAGAHRDEPEGAALHVWLLHIGGQENAAQRLLREARKESPQDLALRQLDQWMAHPKLACTTLDKLLFHPYSLPAAPRNSRMRGSAVLIDGGRSAIAPAAVVTSVKAIWLRNGLGQLSRAKLERRLETEGLVLLRLEKPMPIPADYALTARRSFPGSIGFAVEYPAVDCSRAIWPRLRNGFLGSPLGDGPDLDLGITLPEGAHGGPVFDGAGALSGIALPGPRGTVLFHSVGRLTREFGIAMLSPATPQRPRVPVEVVYETAMAVTLQVLAAR